MRTPKDSSVTWKRVNEGLEILRSALEPYVREHMRAKFGEEWQRQASRQKGSNLDSSLDVLALLKTMQAHWNEVFSKDAKLKKARALLALAITARHSVAHYSGGITLREGLRYLDAIRELVNAVGSVGLCNEVDSLYNIQYDLVGASEVSTPSHFSSEEQTSYAGTTPWRLVCEPHRDVLEARFTDAEFAVNLAQVSRGGGFEEYHNPAEFFRITYPTHGLRQLLTRAVGRLCGGVGDPVISLQTTFGGGKTHSMLALYHIGNSLKSGYNPAELDGMTSIFGEAGVTGHFDISQAIFVGTDKGVSEVMHKENDRVIQTLWGYLAWQLGGWSAYESIEKSDLAKTNPGTEKLIAILSSAAPCMILLDEVVAFGSQLTGSYCEAFYAFMQSLTDAATAVDGCVVVASLPHSDIEVGDEQGRNALRRLEKVFGRTQAAWMPASGIESYEIVRRRLFLPLDVKGEKERENTIQAFRKLYRSSPKDFPMEVFEKSYIEQMRSAYPLHPELLKQFSNNWSTLEKFQRTRGILKIMANAVYALWYDQNSAPLILPADIPFYDTKVCAGLLEPLDRSYGPILQSEVEGEQSLATRIESQRPRLSRYNAATRTARAVFFATAPQSGEGRGGVSMSQIRLSCAMPGDQVAIYGDALQYIFSSSAYLYRNDDSFWYSPKPTLNKLVRDRANEVSDEVADQRINDILSEEQKVRAGFSRIHVSLDNPTDVEDRHSVALIILPPSDSHSEDNGAMSTAANTARDVIMKKGSGQRNYRNCLLFVAPDASGLQAVRDCARRDVAWKSLRSDSTRRKGMTQSQIEELESQASHSTESLRRSIRKTWAYLLFPSQTSNLGENNGHSTTFIIERSRMLNRDGAKEIPVAVWDKVSTDGTVIQNLGTEYLSEYLVKLWPEDVSHIAIEQLRDWFSSYVYLPRLRDVTAFNEALLRLIEDLVAPYGFASSYDEERGVYHGAIDRDQLNPDLLLSGLLVKRSALQSKNVEHTVSPPARHTGEENGTKDVTAPNEQQEKEWIAPKRFFANLPIDPDHAGVEVANIMKDLLVELTRSPGSTLKVNLEIHGTGGKSGYPKDVVDTVNANASDLRIDESSIGFSEE